MPTTRLLIVICCICITSLQAGRAAGQNYPNKPIRIVTAEAGGASNFTSRLIAEALMASLNQSVIVDNRAGNISIEVVAKAPPDGYTLLVSGSTFILTSLLQKMSYDPVRDFLPISLLTKSPSILVVHPALAANSVKELIALAKARPGELNYAASLTGSPNHFAGELFKSMAGVDIVGVPYKGVAAALNDVISGRVQLMFVASAAAAAHTKSGKLRTLAIASATPSALAPHLPTITASGVPGYEAVSVTGMFAPAKTPAAIINRLNREIVTFLDKPDVKEKFLTIGLEPGSSSPAQFAATVKAELARAAKLIKDAGIKAD